MRLLPSQLRTISVAAALLLLMGVFPPWIETVDHRYGKTERPAGYALIFDPPHPSFSSRLAGVRLDLARLLLQWAILSIGSGVILLWQGSRGFPQERSLRKVEPNCQEDARTESTLANKIDHAPPPAKQLGLKWFYFWTYVNLPVSAISGIILSVNVPIVAALSFPLSILEIAIASGLHRRTYWAWRLNWVAVYSRWLLMAVPFTAKSQKEFLILYPLFLLLTSALWLWPNIIYWKKRRLLFEINTIESSGDVAR